MKLRFSPSRDINKDYPAGEIYPNLREMKNSILEKKFSFTEAGREFLIGIGTSEERVVSSCRGSLEDYCGENRMVKGLHYEVSETKSVGAIYYKEVTEILRERAKLKGRKKHEGKGFNKRGRPRKS
ncbi:hypothetical protein HY449_01605 [Candidatus Pacearchaeota archaeon]|nr:hypothetical protein [Candidatus Pacearchaeota archaeon]